MPDARAIIDGSPGTYFVNETDRPLYQFHVSGLNTCGLCYQFSEKIARYWPLPLHANCRCKQSIVKPGQRAKNPFVDFEKLVAKLSVPEQARVMGASCFKLWRAGVVDWSDVVTPGRIRSLEEVAALGKLSVARMVKAGVSRAVAERAHAATHTDEHQAAEAHRKRLIASIAGAGVAHDVVVKHLAQRMAGRAGIAAGPTRTTKSGVVIPGIAAGSLMPSKEVRQQHADELAAMLASPGAIRKAVAAMKTMPAKKAAAAKAKALATVAEPGATVATPPPPTPIVAHPDPEDAIFEAALGGIEKAGPTPTPIPMVPKATPVRGEPIPTPAEPIPAKDAGGWKPTPAREFRKFDRTGEADRWFRGANYEKWAAGLTDREREMIGHYKGSFYRAINEDLRMPGVFPETPIVKEYVARLDDVLARHPLPEPATVVRFFDLEKAGLKREGLKVGDALTDAGYVSTSANPRHRWGGDRVEIRVPAGTHAAYVQAATPDHQDEYELLIGRGYTYRVAELRKDKERTIVMELVPGDRKR